MNVEGIWTALWSTKYQDKHFTPDKSPSSAEQAKCFKSVESLNEVLCLHSWRTSHSKLLPRLYPSVSIRHFNIKNCFLIRLSLCSVLPQKVASNSSDHSLIIILCGPCPVRSTEQSRAWLNITYIWLLVFQKTVDERGHKWDFPAPSALWTVIARRCASGTWILNASVSILRLRWSLVFSYTH